MTRRLAHHIRVRRRLNARTSCGILAALGVIAVIAGGCGASGRPRSNQSSSLHVRSSITDRAVLTDPTAWTAQAVGVPTHDTVKAVEFIIDGGVRWTEHTPPYYFNDDYNHLYPWVLGAGQHRLGVRLITSAGNSASTSAEVTVSVRAAAGCPGRNLYAVGDGRRRRADPILPNRAGQPSVARGPMATAPRPRRRAALRRPTRQRR